jgi:hypothetical protein
MHPDPDLGKRANKVLKVANTNTTGNGTQKKPRIRGVFQSSSLRLTR